MENYEKLYKEALEKARDYHSKCIKGKGIVSFSEKALEAMFPELKESEDEKIRKALIKAVEDNIFCYEFVHKKDMLAWLEKQGKCPNKVIVSKELYEHIRNTCACIDDAMSSETLVDVNDYLEQADKSAKNAFEMIKKQGEQKPVAWSEEDEKILDSIIFKLQHDGGIIYQDKIDWLKSLKPQSHWKPTKEQLGDLLEIEGILRNGTHHILATRLVDLYKELKTL